MKKRRYILLTLVAMLFLSSCGYIGVYIIAKSATCEIKVNENVIKGSCELINGVFIEKLDVIEKDTNGIPLKYYVTQRFECYNPGVDGVQKYWPDKIYFNKKNGHYKWGADTVKILFHRHGRNRDVVIQDSISGGIKTRMYGYFISGSNKYEICPIKFRKDCWYYLTTYDPRISSIYIYVDNKMKFRVYKFDSGVCPI
ncbi:MAG: hypothetical protein K9J13_14210 [Saprospiraceae bacterium]|nr:hypothetical protein [Saprospiraceae bacterium]